MELHVNPPEKINLFLECIQVLHASSGVGRPLWKKFASTGVGLQVAGDEL